MERLGSLDHGARRRDPIGRRARRTNPTLSIDYMDKRRVLPRLDIPNIAISNVGTAVYRRNQRDRRGPRRSRRSGRFRGCTGGRVGIRAEVERGDRPRFDGPKVPMRPRQSRRRTVPGSVRSCLRPDRRPRFRLVEPLRTSPASSGARSEQRAVAERSRILSVFVSHYTVYNRCPFSH